MRILVGIPAYDGKVCVETVQSLLNERLAAHAMGLDLDVHILPRTSLVHLARNQIVQAFMASDADKLVFLDADVSFEVGSLIRLAHYPFDVVGGAYRKKTAAETYSVMLPLGENWTNAHGLLEAEALPGGFLAISRAAFERLAEAFPGRAYQLEGVTYQGYFHCPIEDGIVWGEDNRFCADWRGLGGRVWLDPELTLTHVDGATHYTGCIGRWLQARVLQAA